MYFCDIWEGACISSGIVVTSPRYCNQYVCLCFCLCVCLCVCLSTCITRKPHSQTSPNLLCILPVAVARSFSDGIVICYVLPVYRGINGGTGMALCGLPWGAASGHGCWPGAAHWLSRQACTSGGCPLWCWLSSGWTLLLPGQWCVFCSVLYASSELCTGGKVSTSYDCLV